MKRLRPKIYGAVERILEEMAFAFPPIDVESIARQLGLSVIRHYFRRRVRDDGSSEESRINGFLVGDRIFVNAEHNPRRQRFTIAHEIAHKLLSPPQPIVLSGLVDTDSPEERSMNAFASELLMPESMVREAVERFKGRRESGEAVRFSDLCREFDVSVQAMKYRLSELDL